MRRALLTILPFVALSTADAEMLLPEPTERFQVSFIEPGPLVHIATEDTAAGYKYIYANREESAVVYEPYAATVERAGLPQLICTTGHCGSASAGPVKPASGCACGCSAGACNCAHSPNVGRTYLTSLHETATQQTSEDVVLPEPQPSAVSPSESREALPTSSLAPTPATPAAAVYHYERVCTGSGCSWVRVAGPPVAGRPVVGAPVRAVRGVFQARPVRGLLQRRPRLLGRLFGRGC